jgi:hypothetical protein
MRLWSIHPSYLDRQGLLAVWRESLLAQKVLLGYTKGYRNHPQLIRFKRKHAITLIEDYLKSIYFEAKSRGYHFNYSKICSDHSSGIFKEQILVTEGQLEYEFRHLLKKLRNRDVFRWINLITKYADLKYKIASHPLFKVVKGDIENWEKIK